MMRFVLLFAPSVALAQVAPECQGMEKPEDYNEQVQQDFLANYVGLSLTYSPAHAPIPHEAGRGALGLDLAVIPPMSCKRRFVLEWTKTEDTNKLPILPRPRATFAFPAIGRVHPYAGVAYVPPLTVAGLTSTIVSAEVGAGMTLGEEEALQLGLRFHATNAKIVSDIATAFNFADPDVLDFFSATSLGLDLSVGYDMGVVTPYASLGLTDVSTFFYIGDDGVVTNNLHPYLGPVLSLGADALVKNRLRLGGEFYAAPGGHNRPDKTAENVVGFGGYGHLYTARLRIAVEL